VKRVIQAGIVESVFFAATTRENGDSRSKREWNSYEFRTIFAVPRQSGTKNPSDGDTHEGRCHIGAVVHVLIEHPPLAGRPAAIADEPHRNNIQQERGGTAVR
jgi:hypothetical protein